MKKILSIVLVAIITAGPLAAAPKASTKKQMKAYLMIYFKDETHGLYLALSPDGYSFMDVNNAQPVIAGDTIAAQKGIRDPHIMRGPDGRFYVAMTDLHIYAQKAAYRDTQWERDGDKYGWGNNRGLVFITSDDLIHWTHTAYKLQGAFPGLDDIGCAWAPELIWDPEKEKIMIYFTMRHGNGRNRLYYAYMNNDFTAFETAPELLFTHPRDISYIDADITYANGKYHMFYVPHEKEGGGIKQAVSDKINRGYVYDDTWYDSEPRSCEAPNVWRRLGTNKWVLMYDIFSITPHNFGFRETADFVNFTDLGHFNEGVMKSTNFSSPKHGAVIHLTKKEAERLARHWGLKMKF